MPDLLLEQAMAARYAGPIAGLDEVGRGPWAGPVTACAVVIEYPTIPFGGLPEDLYNALDDSKSLSASKRDILAPRLARLLPHAIAESSVEEIAELNILQASLLVMRRALDALPIKPSGALVDGNRDPDLGIPTDLIIKGDQRSIAISAASILAKTHRDTVMKKLSQSCPGYGWETNMGYGTKAHQQALKSLGITPHHRKNFAPVRKAMT